MRTIIVAILAAFLLTTGAFSALSAEPAFGNEDGNFTVLERPEVRRGDIFVYNKYNGWTDKIEGVFVNEVMQVSDDKILLGVRPKASTSRPTILEFTRDWNILKNRNSVYTPHFPANKFPVSKGDVWEGKSTRADLVADERAEYTVSAKAAGIEEVTVPAGNFRTMKIVVNTQYRVSNRVGVGSGKRTEIFWYTPGISKFVKSTYEDTNWAGAPLNNERFELVEFVKGK